MEECVTVSLLYSKEMTATGVYGIVESQNLSIRSLPLKAVFHRRLSPIKGRLPSKGVHYHLAAPDVL